MLNVYADARASVLKEGHRIARPPLYYQRINKTIHSCTNGVQNVRVSAYRNFCITSTNSAWNPLIALTESANCPQGIHTAVCSCQRITCGICPVSCTVYVLVTTELLGRNMFTDRRPKSVVSKCITPCRSSVVTSLSPQWRSKLCTIICISNASSSRYVAQNGKANRAFYKGSSFSA